MSLDGIRVDATRGEAGEARVTLTRYDVVVADMTPREARSLAEKMLDVAGLARSEEKTKGDG